VRRAVFAGSKPIGSGAEAVRKRAQGEREQSEGEHLTRLGVVRVFGFKRTRHGGSTDLCSPGFEKEVSLE